MTPLDPSNRTPNTSQPSFPPNWDVAFMVAAFIGMIACFAVPPPAGLIILIIVVMTWVVNEIYARGFRALMQILENRRK